MKIMIEVDYSVSFVCKVFDAGFIDNMNMNALSTKVDMHDWKWKLREETLMAGIGPIHRPAYANDGWFNDAWWMDDGWWMMDDGHHTSLCKPTNSSLFSEHCNWLHSTQYKFISQHYW